MKSGHWFDATGGMSRVDAITYAYRTALRVWYIWEKGSGHQWYYVGEDLPKRVKLDVIRRRYVVSEIT